MLSRTSTSTVSPSSADFLGEEGERKKLLWERQTADVVQNVQSEVVKVGKRRSKSSGKKEKRKGPRKKK